VKPSGEADKSNQRLGDQAHARFVEINSADLSLADLRGSQETLQQVIRDEALIDATQHL
jgi:hypothetical protein